MAQSNAEKKAVARKRRQARLKHQNQASKPKRVKEDKLEKLSQLNAQLQGAMLNLRQMYDQATMEKEQLKGQVAQRDQLITAASLADNGLYIEKDDMLLVKEGEVVGYNFADEADDGSIAINPVWKAEYEASLEAEEAEINDALDAYEAPTAGEILDAIEEIQAEDGV